ncbi:MAG: o-succinylbenzoate synthase [Solibacterales bacterium]|nr:o-succinylbenzoate synthase [Bryobacterales bacterium]|tara:strand:- start:1756 stop:2862 length:1107 start_codon:yes stop_codon:yes gene_type:complete
MKIGRIILREIRIPLVHFFETSFGRTTNRRIVLVEVESGGAVGWGEVTAGERPFYNEEWTDAAWSVLRDFVAPRVIGKTLKSASQATQLSSGIRGHQMACGGLEAALWHLESCLIGVPLWKHIGGIRKEIACGVSIGIQDSVEKLLDLIEQETAAGYQRIKIKIKPGWDVDVVHQVRDRFPDVQLMADANSAYTLDDSEHLKQLDAFQLMMIEQPLAHDEIIDHAKLQAKMSTPICLDECIRSAHHARQAIEMGAAQIINIKLGRVGGFSEALKVHAVCRDQGVPVWCGGMLEAGIGRAHNVALSTLEGFSLPGDVSASSRYWKRDVINPPVEVSEIGTIQAPEAIGLGYEIDQDYIETLTVRKEVLR